VVPPPHEWPSLIQKVHSELRHFGIKRIYSLLALHYHWRRMYAQVQDVIARCEQCDKVRISFSSRQLTLSPFFIQGMFYRWSCDLARELPQTSRGNVYIMIMIEHFSKWVELVTLPDKSSHSTSQVFLQEVLSKFRACVECLTDQRSKFRGEFQDLLDHALIDHRRTSRDHPQIDGLVERMVQTCKKGFRNIYLIKNKEDWDLTSPWVTGCPIMPPCLISLLTFYFLGDIPFHPFPLLFKWTKLWTWIPQPLGLGSLQKGLLYLGGLCHGHGEPVHCITSRHLTICTHTRW